MAVSLQITILCVGCNWSLSQYPYLSVTRNYYPKIYSSHTLPSVVFESLIGRLKGWVGATSMECALDTHSKPWNFELRKKKSKKKKKKTNKKKKRKRKKGTYTYTRAHVVRYLLSLV